MSASHPFNKVLRLAFGASLGLLLAKLTNSDQWGVFFTISPVLLLGLIPRLTPFVVLQYLSANLLAGVMVLLYSWLGSLSAVMTVLVFFYFLWLFRLMAKGAFLYLPLLPLLMAVSFYILPVIPIWIRARCLEMHCWRCYARY